MWVVVVERNGFDQQHAFGVQLAATASLGGSGCRPAALLMCTVFFLPPAGLNMAVFLLIGKTSALTMNIAGVVKDWMLIGLSVWMFNSAVSGLNLLG